MSWSNQGLAKNYVASGAIAAYSVVKPGATAGTVALRVPAQATGTSRRRTDKQVTQPSSLMNSPMSTGTGV